MRCALAFRSAFGHLLTQQGNQVLHCGTFQRINLLRLELRTWSMFEQVDRQMLHGLRVAALRQPCCKKPLVPGGG
jgi:hypothetical protein